MSGKDEVTFAECTLNARRLLQNAEMETDLAKMERIEKLADSWIVLAQIVDKREASA